mgnify:FL=1
MAEQICPNCQTLAEPGTVFCEHCGLRLPSTAVSAESTACPACGSLNLPGETFCRQCGVVLAPVAGLPPPLPRQLHAQESPPKASGHAQPPLSGPPTPQIPIGDQAAPAPLETVTGSLCQRETNRQVSFPPGKPQLLVGRADAAEGFFPDIDLEPLAGEHLGVSRRHALLTASQGQVFITDLNSTNFTFVNHQVLPAGQKTPLRPGDIVQFGQLVLVYEGVV